MTKVNLGQSVESPKLYKRILRQFSKNMSCWVYGLLEYNYVMKSEATVEQWLYLPIPQYGGIYNHDSGGLEIHMLAISQPSETMPIRNLTMFWMTQYAQKKFLLKQRPCWLRILTFVGSQR